MTTKRAELDRKYVAAGDRLKAADEQVRRASRAHLSKLMRLPDRERLQHMEDATLTKEDRTALRRSIAARLPGHRNRFLRPRRRLNWSGIARRLPAIAIVVATLAPIVVWALLAWLNTGEIFTTMQTNHIEWQLPDGKTTLQTLLPGERYVLVRHAVMQGYFRSWRVREGYATATVNVGPSR